MGILLHDPNITTKDRKLTSIHCCPLIFRAYKVLQLSHQCLNLIAKGSSLQPHIVFCYRPSSLFFCWKQPFNLSLVFMSLTHFEVYRTVTLQNTPQCALSLLSCDYIQVWHVWQNYTEVVLCSFCVMTGGIQFQFVPLQALFSSIA